MIKEALQYLVSLKNPSIIEKNGGIYSDINLVLIPEKKDPQHEKIHIHTLTGMIDYCNIIDDKVIIHIQDERTIICSSLSIDQWKRREVYASVNPINRNNFQIDQYYDLDQFIIELQTKFVKNEQIINLLKILGNVTDTEVKEYSDDGIAQKLIIRSGINMKSEAILPTILSLAPYRTFNEIEQPESLYLFRAKKGENSIKCALFNCDADQWKLEAIRRIKDWILKSISQKDIDEGKYIIVA